MTKFIYLLPLFITTTLFAEEEATAPERSMWQTIIMIGIALAFFYFILWRPEQKKRKTLETQRETLKKGDRVTAMGIIGTIVKIEQDTVILKMHDGSSEIEVLKGVVTEVL